MCLTGKYFSIFTVTWRRCTCVFRSVNLQ
jgi:hypothetical protein